MSTADSRRPCERRPPRLNHAATAAAIGGAALMLAWSWPSATRIDAPAGALQNASEIITLDGLLERAGAYVLSFEGRFSNVVTEERYVQEAIPPNGGLTMVIP